jgi:type II secretory pathway pseudopilin PulG
MSRVVRLVPAAAVNFMSPSRQVFFTRDEMRCSYFQVGFSYFWLLFLVAFLGIGLALTSEMLVTAQQRDKERELLAVGHQFRQAIASYYEAQQGNSRLQVSQSIPTAVTGTTSGGINQRQYPASLEELLLDQRSQATKRHLRKIFVDPITGKAEWGLYKQNGRVVGVFSLSEKQPIKVEGFEADDASFRQKTKYSEWIFSYPSDAIDRVNDNQATRPALTTGISLPISSTPTTDTKTN